MENREFLEVVPGEYNLQSYDEASANFSWEEVEKEFSWYTTGKVNIAYEAVDRQAESWRKNKVALYYSDATRDERYTFQDLKYLSNRCGNVLRNLGIGKGDRVFIFMPRSPELYISFLGIVKIGAIAGPLFEAFMEAAVKDRLADSEAVAIITTPELKKRLLKSELPALKHIILVGAAGELAPGEVNWHAEMAKASEKLEIEWVDREDPMLLLYTSGSTGKPKGVIHVHYG